jgi:alpha-tubulin suppressor-like RCC1 family protein
MGLRTQETGTFGIVKDGFCIYLHQERARVMSRRISQLTKFILVVLALAACGGSKGSSSQSGPVATDLQTSINGWSFPNYPASSFPDTDFNEEDLVSMFGSGEDVCVGAVATPCKLTAEASAWARMVNQSRASGHCEGLVAIASTRFNNNESPVTVKLPSQGETLHAVMRAFATQFLPEVQDAINQWINKSLEEKIDELKNSFTAGTLNYTLGLYTEGGGHALLPYAVEYPTPSTPKILLYDSNWPGKNRYVDVDLNAKTWRFSFSGEDPANDPDAWTGGPQDMDLTPISARAGTCPFCSDSTKVAKTTMLIRSTNLDWSVETNGGVVSPANPVGTDGTSVLPVKGSVKRDSYDYWVSVPTSSDSSSATTVANKETSNTKSKLKFSASTSVYAMMPDGIAQFTTSGKSDNPVEIEGSSISTKDPAVDLTLASGNLVANASGAAISLSVSGGTMEVAVTTASGQVVQQQVSEDKPTLQMKADSTGGGITVLAASSTGVVEKTEVSSSGVETKTIVKEVLNLSAVKAELPPELASKEIAALPSLANRNMANPNYKVDPVYVAPTTTVPKESSGGVVKNGAPQTPTVGRLNLPSVEFGDVPFTVQEPTSNSKGEWRFSSSKSDIAQINATTGRVTIAGAGTTTITATQAREKDYESISVTAELTVARATPVLGAFTTTTRTVGEEAFTLANPTSTSSAVFKLESSDESVARFSKVNGKLSIVGAGRTTITASQPANEDYLAASKNFVLTVRKGTPVLSTMSDLSATFGESGPTIAKPTSESRGAITFTSNNTAVATINATTGQVSIIGAGTTTVTATQAATDDYVSATQTLTFTVKPALPALGALSIGSKTFGDANFSIAKPTSLSSGSFTFTSSNSKVVKISEAGAATIEGAGTTTITATQAAAGNYSANSVTADITVAKGTPELSNISLTGLVFGAADVTMQPRSTSSGAFTFTSNNARVLTVNETTGRVRVVSAGTATITVRQASTTNYEAASSSVTVQVGLATPAFQRLDPITKEFGDASFLFNWGTSPSDGSIAYSIVQTSNVATIDTTGRVTIIGTGVATLTMTQSQGTNHTAASIVVVLTVERGTPVYGDFVIPNKTYGAADFLLTRPTTTSSGAFTFNTRLNGTLNDTSIATVDSDGLITVVAPGSVEIIATQAQTNTHTASSIVTTFVVAQATPTLSGFGGQSAGLAGTRYVDYYADDPDWFADATLHGDTVTSTQIQNFSSNTEYYSWQWLGTFRSAAAGTYNFCTDSDDASHLWIGESATSGFTTSNAIVDNAGLHPVQTQCGNVTLAASTDYPIRIQFGEYTGEDAISVYFTPPGGTATYDGTGYFYSGGGLTKTLGDQPFTPTIPTSASTGAITYTSSNTSVATIHPTSGEITVLSGGTTTITATQAATTTHTSGSISTTLTVESTAITRLSLGLHNSCGLTNTGAMKCWGYNGWGQIGTLAAGVQTTPSDLPGYTNNISAIAAGHYHTCALTTDGAVSCFGYNWNNNLSPGISSGAVDISAGYLHTCALMSYGGVKCWGRNDSGGQLGDGTNTNRVAAVDVLGLTSGVTAITTGMEFSCALLNTGAVKCWGYNGYGQIGDDTNTNRNVPTQVSGIESGAVAIVGGNNHACALLATGAVKCWGANYYGQIGDATTSNRLTPITITSLGTSVRSINAGWEHTCAVTTSGAAKCWGRNSEGSLGDGTLTNRYAPVDVIGLDSGVLDINADKSLTTCATVSGNNVKCWGYNGWGNVGDASTNTRSSPVDVFGLPSGTASNTTLGALTLPSSRYSTSSADFTLTAPTSSRAGTFSYASSNPEVVTVNAETGVVHIEGIGTAVLGASIGGNGQYRATSAQVTITVGFSCANGGLCSIGDTGPGGGVVFYDAGSNQSWGRYLEFAPSTSQVSRTWSTGTNQQIEVSGADGTAIGTGLQNTSLIAAQSGNLAASSAASYAASYSNNNKSDWFVPSKAELNELCKYARNTGQAAGSSTRCSGGSAPTLRGFTADWHWSSSQSGNNGALDQNFYDGDQGGDGKDWTGIVRPVRAITPLTDCQLAIACAVGDLGPAGGRIIYVNPTQSNQYDFVEAAPTDIAPTLWCAGPKANTVIGSDNAYRDFDSAPIVSTVQLRNCTSGAGTSAQNYSANGISGWQIPNHALVSRMRTALFDNGLGSFISTDYLTSNEQDATHYVTVDMTNGQMSYPDKSTATRLRPVRFFAKADRSRKIPTLNLSVPATSYAYGAADFYTSASSTGVNDFGGSFTSRGSISYASSNTAVATVDSYTGLVSIVGSGSFTITATQSAWGIFKAPTSVSTNISVANGTPQFSGFAIPGSGYRADDGSFDTTNATSSSSSGAITYTSSNTAVATINATTGRVTLVTAGTTTFTATLAQNGFWDGATLTVSLAVGALCADGGECRMGDIGPGGGRIFLLPTSTGNTTNKYFEAAVSDLPSALAWCDDTATSITGANGYAYGTGEANTTAIDAACTSGAAQGAADYINNSIGDWYLPSLDELTAMLAERTTIGGFASASYWSSSEENGGYAKRLGFPDGGMSGHVKSQLFQVRPIRSFEIRRSCLDIKTATGTNTNGVYTIALNVSGAVINTQVYCLMDSAMSGGGWTLTMKAPSYSTSFGFNANYWTTANTLNEGNTANVTSDATNAKFNTFNYLSGTEMLAVFPDAGINGGSVTGHTYGWTWKQTIPSGPKTPLEIFSGPMEQFIGDADNFSGFDTRIFSRQKDIRFYGFNWYDNHQSRWGFGWNENGGGLWPNGYMGSDDVSGGIGLGYNSYSAGDMHFGWSTSVGLSRPMSFETYVR